MPIIPLELSLREKDRLPVERGEDDYLLTTKLFYGYCGALMFGEKRHKPIG